MSALAVIAGATALYGGISANQASQNQKGALTQGLQNQTQNYAALSPFRNTSTNLLNSAENPNTLASEFYDPANPYAQGGSGSFTPITTASGAYSGDVNSALNKLTTAPSPTQLAQSEFAQLLAQEAPQEAQQMQQVGQNAAKFGTLGAGMTTSQLGDVATINQRNLLNAGQSLANTAGQQTLQDYMQQLQQLQGMNQQDLALQTQQQGVNTSLGAQAVGFNQAAQNQNYNQAIGAANVGFNPGQQPNYTPISNYYGNQATIGNQGLVSGLGAVGKVLGNQPNNSLAAPGYNPNPTYTYNPGAYTTNLGVGG